MSSNAAPVVEPTMSFLEHLDELRRRLTYSAIAIAITFTVCFVYSEQIYHFLDAPVREALKKQREIQLSAGKVAISPIEELPDNATFTYVFNKEANLKGITIPAGTTMPAKLEK